MIFQFVSAALVVFFSCASPDSTLERFLEWAQRDSEALQAIDKKIIALETEIESRDIVLSSTLSLNAENFNNNQEAIQFARRARDRFATITLTQPFSTGSMFSLRAGHNRAVIDNRGLFQFADWEARLTQSLWRDGFGRATSLRHSGEQQELLSRKAALLYEKNLILIDLESLYWDLSRLLQEEDIRKKSLQASRDLLSWMRARVKNLAAENVDQLQVEALVSGRELDLISVQNQIASLRVRIQSLIPNFPSEKWTPDPLQLEQARSLKTLASGLSQAGEPPLRWDSLSSLSLVQQAEIESKKVREQLKPQLDVFISYGQNGISDTFEEAWRHAGMDRYSGTRIGLTFSTPLQRKLANKQVLAKQLEAEANRMEASAQKRSSLLNWQDLERQQKMVLSQSEEATRLAQFQMKKTIAERRRHKIGRTTLFQLVSFEVEAAEAAARRLLFLAELRKVESQARLFTFERGVQ